MKSGPSRSIIVALPILAAAALGCVGETADPTVAEVLVDPAAEPAAAPADIVPTWASEDGVSEADLRALLTDLADRVAVREPDAAGWQEAPSDAAL